MVSFEADRQNKDMNDETGNPETVHSNLADIPYAQLSAGR